MTFNDIDQDGDGVITKQEWNSAMKGKKKRGRRKGQKAKPSVTQSDRAGLTFPVGRIGRFMR